DRGNRRPKRKSTCRGESFGLVVTRLVAASVERGVPFRAAAFRRYASATNPSGSTSGITGNPAEFDAADGGDSCVSSRSSYAGYSRVTRGGWCDWGRFAIRSGWKA